MLSHLLRAGHTYVHKKKPLKLLFQLYTTSEAPPALGEAAGIRAVVRRLFCIRMQLRNRSVMLNTCSRTKKCCVSV